MDRISIELTNRCRKACWFCYNRSRAAGRTLWTVDELVALISDCVDHGVKAVSLGGGEPLQSEGLFELLERTHGTVFRSLTTNGLDLRAELLARLLSAAPEKVQLSIHFPQNTAEVDRVIEQAVALPAEGIRSGINLLISRSAVDEARSAASRIRRRGIANDRIVYLPMRGADTPTAQQVAEVAGNQPFQSMTCLMTCGRSPRFCSLDWQKRVAWCSYTESRRPLIGLTYGDLIHTLDGLDLSFCGGVFDARLSGSPQH